MQVLEALPVSLDEQNFLLVQEVLNSRSFERTRSLRRLLEYLWEHRREEINEYAIATEALGRSADFDSKIDATVRVQIGRLRRNLDRFYTENGIHHGRRLVIPVGSHQVGVLAAEDVPGHLNPSANAIEISSADPAGHASTAEIPQVIVRPLIPAAAGYGILAGVVLCLVLLTLEFFQGGPFLRTEHREPPPFWKVFLDNGKNTRIVLPAPLFFAWKASDGRTLMLRDITVNDPAQWTASPALTSIVGEQQPEPRIWQNYTVASDTFASLQLARFLDGYGISTSFSSSANLPSEIVDHENIVTFGTKNSLAAYQSDLDRLSFRMAPEETKVTDLLSPPDHPREFLRVHESGERDVVPGIIAVIPRGRSGTRIMLLQGTDTMALIAYLTSDEGAREISDALRGNATPYFEAVILSEVNRGTPLQSRLGAIRPFTGPPPQNVEKIAQVQETTR